VAQRFRPGLTAEQKRDMWSRWKAGQSLSEIGRALGRERSAIHRMVATTGGYVPVDRRRSPRVLSSAEREEISRGLAEGVSLRVIARRSGRAASTISREVARHVAEAFEQLAELGLAFLRDLLPGREFPPILPSFVPGTSRGRPRAGRTCRSTACRPSPSRVRGARRQLVRGGLPPITNGAADHDRIAGRLDDKVAGRRQVGAPACWRLLRRSRTTTAAIAGVTLTPHDGMGRLLPAPRSSASVVRNPPG
jgi:predicted transcriptional regulator